MNRFILVLFLGTAIALSAVDRLSAADRKIEGFLPPSCAPGWVMEGQATTYTPENLYRYIDGEAEIYLPYGFKKAATVRYVKTNPPKGGPRGEGVVVNIFEMGSPLDAFGIYSNYRSSTLPQLKVGAEGFVDETQLMFYQYRHFVQIETSGTLDLGAGLLQKCAKAVSGGLPQGREKPREIELLNVTGAVPLTEKYYPRGLLGYGFFGRGLTVEVTIKGEQAKALIILAGSEEAAGRIFEAYRKYLAEAKVVPRISRDEKGTSLQVIDPLYKGTDLRQSGPFIVGVVGLKEPLEGEGIVGQLLERLPGR